MHLSLLALALAGAACATAAGWSNAGISMPIDRKLTSTSLSAKERFYQASLRHGKTVERRNLSQKALERIQDGKPTPAEPVAYANSTGLDIEGNDIGYFITVMIGTPPRPFKVLLDTGSGDFWVPSDQCKQCGSHQRLGESTSSTFTATGKNFSIMYGSGAANGELVTDHVSIAGMTLKNHNFGVVFTESTSFSDPDVPFDGLMGLSGSQLSREGVDSPVHAMLREGLIKQPQMGFALGRAGDPQNNGIVTFGGVDTSRYYGRMTELPLSTENGFWEVQMDDVLVDGKPLGLGPHNAIFDTGTTLLLFPSDYALQIHKQIPGSMIAEGQGGSKTFAIPCDTTSQVTLQFGGTPFAISAKDLIYEPLQSASVQNLCLSSISGTGNVAADGSPDTVLIGDAFLKNVYFATDSSRKVIGLAPNQIS